MDDSKRGDAPQTGASYMGATGDAPDANTNLDPDMQGGESGADRQATNSIEDRHTESRGLGSGENEQSDPARQMDNSGMVDTTGQGEDSDIIGASGDDRNAER